jgi:DNA-binding CsgD family transcriptional regulator
MSSLLRPYDEGGIAWPEDGRKQARVFSTAGQAVCVIGSTGKILTATPEFTNLVGDAIFVFNGRMRAARREDNAALQALLLSLTNSLRFDNDTPAATARLTRSDGTTIAAHGISILGGGTLPARVPVAILIIETSDTHPAGEQAFCKTHGLTGAEARLAARLVAGVSLRKAAATEGITYETARSRLKAIFRKTGTTRQAELVLLLSRSR